MQIFLLVITFFARFCKFIVIFILRRIKNLYYYNMERSKPNKKIGFIVAAMMFGVISCADLPKTNEAQFLGESATLDEYEDIDEATRKETEYKADSIIKKYNTKFAENCTSYSDGQKQKKRIDCVTFK